MEPMIQRMAEAIETATHRTKKRGNWEDVARDALEALLHPTDGMVKAGWIDKEDVNPDDIFKAMIRAALDGK